MSISTTYFLNVALHSAILSVLAAAILPVIREARHRSVSAIAGLLAVAVLPWISALRTASEITSVGTGNLSAAVDLATWTVATLPAAPHEITSAARTGITASETMFSEPVGFAIALCPAGTAIGLVLLGFASLRVLIWRKSLKPIDDLSWEKLQAALPGLGGRNRFLVTGQPASPCVTGFWSPRIVIPRSLLAAESNDELAWSVRHEVAHFRAGDSRWTMLFAIIRCLNWWNPVVHHLVFRWVDVREQLCDLHAAGGSGNRANYGKFLVAMAGHITALPPLTVAMAHRRCARRLKARIVSLLNAEENSGGPVGKRFVGLACCVVLACAAMISCMRIGGTGQQEVVAGAKMDEASPVGKATTKTRIHSSPVEEKGRTDLVTVPGGNPLQIKFSSKFNETTPEVGFADGGIYNDSQVQLIMRKLAQKRGTDLMTAPSVTARFSERTVVEIIHEVPGSRKQIAARGPKAPIPFVGINLSFVPRLANELIVDLEWAADYRFVPGAGIEAKPPVDMNPDKIKVIKRASSTALSSGKTVCANLGETEHGKFLTLLITAEIIDATGRPFANP
jgi:beta-lactamase regulating signal transducer with metallopeptidase domain